MKERARIVFHSIALIHHLYVTKYCNETEQVFKDATEPEVLIFKIHGHKFFTTWNLIMQTSYVVLALLHDLHRIYTKNSNREIEKKLDLFKGYIFTALVFPSTIFVCCMFWSIYKINRELVLPKVIDSYLPNWVNQSLHTNIMVFLVIELLLTNQKFYIPSFKSAFYGITGLSIVYQSTFFYTYYASGDWLYGLFSVLTWPERIIFSFFNYFTMVAILQFGIILQKWIHGTKNASKIE